jgi:predicted molibdopterin-dependent oxidoreductase YjgC
MTRKVNSLNILRKEELVVINPADAADLGVSEGDMVRVISRRGSVAAKAMLTERSPRGTVSMTFHFAESPTNELISGEPTMLDQVTGTPAYKTCPVRVIKAEPASHKDAMIAALHRASADSAFRAQIAREPIAALKEYGLDDEERAAITSGDVAKIESITGKLDERLRTWFVARQAAAKR